MKFTLWSIVKLGLLLSVLFGFFFVLYDQLFSKPTIHSGVILEKIEVPRGKAASPYIVPYGGSKSYKYAITSEKYHQWIALVKADDEQILKVHCTSNHFETKNVGDTILFKEYQGNLLKIEYLSHSEEDTVAIDWEKVFKH